jgi:hypothetical protein
MPSNCCSLVEGAGHEIGGGDVVALFLEELAHHVEELDRAVDHENMLAAHLRRGRACAAGHGPVPALHPGIVPHSATCEPRLDHDLSH